MAYASTKKDATGCRFTQPRIPYRRSCEIGIVFPFLSPNRGADGCDSSSIIMMPPTKVRGDLRRIILPGTRLNKPTLSSSSHAGRRGCGFRVEPENVRSDQQGYGYHGHD